MGSTAVLAMYVGAATSGMPFLMTLVAHHAGAICHDMACLVAHATALPQGTTCCLVSRGIALVADTSFKLFWAFR